MTTHGRDGGGSVPAAASAGREVVVRAARAGDAPALAAPVTELGYPSDATQITRRFGGLSAGHDDAVFVIVTHARKVVGFVHVAERRLLVSEPFAELEGLFVAEAARRRGAAGRLIAAAEQWALARGIGELRVRARVERDVADLAYRRRGFDLAKEQRLFVKRLA